MDKVRKRIAGLHDLCQKLGNCPICPDLIHAYVDEIQEEFEHFTSEVGEADGEQLSALLEAYIQAKEKLVRRMVLLNQELCRSEKFREANNKYLENFLIL